MALAFKYSEFLTVVYPLAFNFRVQYSAQSNILKTVLGINSNEAFSLMSKSKDIATISAEQLSAKVDALQGLGFDGRQTLIAQPRICTLPNHILIRNIKICDECSINFDQQPRAAFKLTHFLGRSPASLKKSHFIEEDSDVLEKMSKILDLVNYESTSLFLSHDSEENTLQHLRESFMSQYLREQYGWIPSFCLPFLKKHNRIFRIPLAQLRDTVQVVNTELKAKPNWILKYNTVLGIHKDEIIALLRHAEDQGISNFKESVITNPRLLQIKPSRIKSMIDVLHEHNIGLDVLESSPLLLLLPPSTVDERIRKIGVIPYLDALRSNKRFGDVICYVNKAAKNIDAVSASDCLGTTVGTLVGPQKEFDRYLQDNNRRNHDVLNYLVSKFCQYDKGAIQTQVMQHSQYLSADLVSVVETYDYLKSEGFDNDTLFSVLPILFYSKIVVQQAYNFIFTEEQPIDFEEYSTAQKLHLVLYVIEKPHHYNGDGVFSEEFERPRSYSAALQDEGDELGSLMTKEN